jgi:hypothetical protein
VKVPNKVLKTALALASEFNGTKTSPPPSAEDVAFLVEWAQGGINKRTAAAAAPKEEN